MQVVRNGSHHDHAYLNLLQLSCVFCASQHQARLLFLQLWSLLCHHDAQQLVLQALTSDAKVEQGDLYKTGAKYNNEQGQCWVTQRHPTVQQGQNWVTETPLDPSCATANLDDRWQAQQCMHVPP